MEQFTASEVRDYLFSIEERSSRQWLIAHDTELGMLRQFADLLEAREKAVPVAYADAATREEILNVAMRKGGYGCEVPLFVHPAPADAERLAEALRELAGKWEQRDYNASRARNAAGHDHAMELRQILTAHSAQAQPPAASVTDAMVERGLEACIQDSDARLSRYKVVRSIIEAALAAQENPNG